MSRSSGFAKKLQRKITKVMITDTPFLPSDIVLLGYIIL